MQTILRRLMIKSDGSSWKGRWVESTLGLGRLSSSVGLATIRKPLVSSRLVVRSVLPVTSIVMISHIQCKPAKASVKLAVHTHTNTMTTLFQTSACVCASVCVCGGGGWGGGGLFVKGSACAHNCVFVYKQIVWCANGDWHMMWVPWWCVYISGVWCGHDGWVWWYVYISGEWCGHDGWVWWCVWLGYGVGMMVGCGGVYMTRVLCGHDGWVWWCIWPGYGVGMMGGCGGVYD